MKVGDLVIFKDGGAYAKWFRGKIGFVIHIGNAHCRVLWAHPVEYHGGLTTTSDFSVCKFKVISSGQAP
jgi:hypothetical protein